MAMLLRLLNTYYWMKREGKGKMDIKLLKNNDFVRYYFECENGRRWTETDLSGQLNSKDGDTCNFSGCLNDHKIKLVKKMDNMSAGNDRFSWFRGWEAWEDTPVYKSMTNLFHDGKIIAYNSQALKTGFSKWESCKRLP